MCNNNIILLVVNYDNKTKSELLLTTFDFYLLKNQWPE